MTLNNLGQRLLVPWVAWVQRRAVAVLVGAVLVTVLAAAVTGSRIGINTDTTDMLSAELPFRRNLAALRQAFPQFTDVLSIVIEAGTPDRAEDAAERLAAALRARTADFEDVFYPQDDPFFRRNGLLYLDLDDLQTLSDRVAEAQPLLAALSRDPSLRGLADVLAQALDPPSGQPPRGLPNTGAKQTATALAPVLDALAVSVESLADSDRGGGSAQPLSWISLLDGKDPTAADKRRFVVVKPRLDFTSLQPAARAIETVRLSARDLDLNERTGVRVRMTGAAILFQEELESVRDGMGVAGLLSIALVIGLLALGLRSGPLIFATLATLGAGLIWTAGFAAVAVGELNLISVAFAVLFIGLSVDFGIHFALRYQEALVPGDRGAPNRIQALDQAVRGVGGPLTLCAVAAAIGFFAFLPTDYRGVSELGLISGVGMFIALFANLTVLPAILRLLPPGPANRLRRNTLGDRLQSLAAARPRAVLSGAAALGVAGLLLLPQAGFDDDPLNLRDPESESVSTLHDVIEDPRVEPFSATILAEDLPAAQALARRLERLEEVASVVTLGSLVPDDQFLKLEIIDQMALFLAPVVRPRSRDAAPGEAELRQALASLHDLLTGVTGPLEERARRLALALDRIAPSAPALAALDRALLGGLPRRLEALAAGLEAELVTIDDLPDQLRRRYQSPAGQTRIEALPREDLRDPAARGRFVDALRRVAPAASGAAIVITEAGRAVIRAFTEAALIAMVLVSLLLFALLGSLRDSAMVLIPLILAAILTAAATVVFRVPFNFANVIVLPLLFGLGVAGGIHMVSRSRQGGNAGLVDGSTPRAVLFSALTTIGSFCALALSSHRGTASMGVLLTIAIGLTMLSTLLVLPALLEVFPRAEPRAGPRASVQGSAIARFWSGRPRIGRRPGLLRVVALLAGLSLLLFIASQVDLARVWTEVLALGALGAVAVCAVYFLAFLVDTASWHLMLPSLRLVPSRLFQLWKVRMVGEALNSLVPAGSLGGEPVKAVLLKRSYGVGYHEGGASLIMAKTVNLLALIGFSAVGLAILHRAQTLAAPVQLAAEAALIALGLGVAGFFAVQRWRAASRAAAWLARRAFGPRLARYLVHIQEVETHFTDFYGGRPGRFAAAFGLAWLNWLIGTAELWVILWFLDRPISWAEAWAIEAVAQLARASFFFIPAGLGAVEGGLVLVLGALAGAPALGLAVAVVRRAREVVWNAWGLWLGWLFSLSPAASDSAAEAGASGGSVARDAIRR